MQALKCHITVLALTMLSSFSLWSQPLLDLKSVEELPDIINSAAEEGYPLYAPDGRLYFVRSLYDGNKGGKLAGQDIWYSERIGEAWSEPSNDLGRLNNRFNNGVVGIADSGSVLYLNSTYSNKRDYQIGLSTSRKIEKGWSAPQRVKMRGFDPRSRFFTFYVDEKNKVMLMSFAKGDKDDEDIYISLKKGLSWSTPTPLTSINTKQAEFAPYLSEDGRNLYFTSNGYPGKGDFDIYMSRRVDDSWLTWSQPISLPEPINSEKFDAYFTIKGTEAFFCSNRNGDFADIFQAMYEEREPTEKELEEMKQEELFADEHVMQGFVVLADSGVLREIDVLDAKGNVLETLNADSTGRFQLVGLEDYSKYFIDLKGEGLADADVYIINRRGDRVYLSQELISGKYPFETLEEDIQAVLIAEVKDQSSFQGTWFELQSAQAMTDGARLQLIDGEGKLVEEQSLNDQGGFEFKKLQVGEYYTLSISEALDDQMLYVRKGGSLVPLSGNILQGLLFKKVQDGSIVLYQDELLASINAAKFRFDYESLDATGALVFLYDENGNVLETAAINEDGLFAFSKLDPDGNYRIGMSEEVDPTIGTLYGYDQDGNVTPLSSGIVLGEYFVGNPGWLMHSDTQLADTETFRFDYNDLPPEGTVVYLTDEEDNIIDSAVVDENGEFQFLRLQPEQAYKIKLKEDADISMGLDRFFVIDAEGEKLGFDSEGKSTRNLVGEELAANTEKFTFDQENLPDPGTVVYLTDEEDNVIDSAVVDENGAFRFLRLKPDQSYNIKLKDDADKSMGLDRFFVIDADGDKVGFEADGTSSKKLIGQELAMTTEKFAFDEEAIPEPGTMVYLTDEEDNVIDSAVVDENGEFRFLRLKADQAYKIKLKDDADRSMGLDRFFVIDAEGQKVAFNEAGESTTELVGKALASVTERFQFDYENLPPAGTVVYLTDDFGNVIDSATVDANGGLRYKRLDDADTYKLKLAKAEDSSDGLGAFSLKDAEGGTLTFNAEGISEGPIIGQDAATNTEAFKFDEDTKPEEGTMVYLTDENDNIVDSAVVDENGEFRFARLSPYGVYKIKMQDAVDNSAGLSSFFLFDAAGNKVELGEDGTSKTRIIGKEEAKLVRFYAFDYDHLPPDGTIIYITDANDMIIDSVMVQDGGFRYRQLDGDKRFGLQMKYADGTMNMGEAFRLLEGEDRKKIKLMNTVDRADYFERMSKGGFADRYDRFVFEGKIPGNGTKVYIYGDQGTLRDSAIVYAQGRFNVEKLKKQRTYTIKVGDQSFDYTQSDLYSLVKQERRLLWKLPSSYSYRPITIEQEDDTEIDFDRFLIDTSEPIASGTKVYLFEKALETSVDSSEIAQDGSFQFKRMDRDKEYNMKFDDGIDVNNALVYAVSDGRQKALPASNGEFVVEKDVLEADTQLAFAVQPAELGIDISQEQVGPDKLAQEEAEDQKDEDITLSLGAIKEDGAIKMEPRKEKPYELTPPVDEEEDVVEVPKTVVNETVFEPVQVEEEPAKPKQAVAVMDDSGWRDLVGKGEVYETKRGYNLQFGFNEFLLSANQIEYLQKVVIPMLKKNPNMKLTIEGHTDSVGSEAVNQRMAVLRASNVLYHLEMAGIEDTQLDIIAKGESEPLAPNELPEGRAINRRVELIKNQVNP